MARVLVGLPALLGDIHKYEKRFDLLELRPIDTSLPRISTLRAWRKAVAPAFVFSVVLPRVVGELGSGPDVDAALASALEVATAVQARCVVLSTPASVRPTAANRSRIAALFQRIPSEGVVLVWEATGIWERDDVIATARAARALPLLDAAREQLGPGPIAYTRLRALGKASGISAAAVERVAERLRGRREAFVVVEGASEASRVRSGLDAALAKGQQRGSGSLIIRPAVAGPLVAEDEEQ